MKSFSVIFLLFSPFIAQALGEQLPEGRYTLSAPRLYSGLVSVEHVDAQNRLHFFDGTSSMMVRIERDGIIRITGTTLGRGELPRSAEGHGMLTDKGTIVGTLALKRGYGFQVERLDVTWTLRPATSEEILEGIKAGLREAYDGLWASGLGVNVENVPEVIESGENRGYSLNEKDIILESISNGDITLNEVGFTIQRDISASFGLIDPDVLLNLRNEILENDRLGYPTNPIGRVSDDSKSEDEDSAGKGLGSKSSGYVLIGIPTVLILLTIGLLVHRVRNSSANIS